MARRYPRENRQNRTLVTATVVICAVVAIYVLYHLTLPKPTPTQSLQTAYNHFDLTSPLTSTHSDSAMTATYTGLDDFSHIHNTAPSQGWKLRSTAFDANGNPIYTFTKAVPGATLQLVLQQTIVSTDERQTSVQMTILH